MYGDVTIKEGVDIQGMVRLSIDAADAIVDTAINMGEHAQTLVANSSGGVIRLDYTQFTIHNGEIALEPEVEATIAASVMCTVQANKVIAGTEEISSSTCHNVIVAE